MKYLILPLVLSISCSSVRAPSSADTYKELSFKTADLKKENLRASYPHLSDDVFEIKFQNSTERPLLFFRSYVNSYYAETKLRGALRTPVFCYGDPHPENFGFISFDKDPQYVLNDIDDTGICPIGLDILRYFSALRLTIDDEEKVKHLALIFQETIAGKKLNQFNFPKPNLIEANEKNLKKYTEFDRILPRKDITLLAPLEKERLSKQLTAQIDDLTIIDIARYHKNDGGSAGLKRYWLIVEKPHGHRELIEYKQTTSPGVSWSGQKQDFAREKTPHFIWGELPDYYGYVVIDKELYMTRTRADDYIDLAQLASHRQMELLSYQVQLFALFHKDNLNKLGGINNEWIIEGSRAIALRYLDAFNRYKR